MQRRCLALRASGLHSTPSTTSKYEQPKRARVNRKTQATPKRNKNCKLAQASPAARPWWAGTKHQASVRTLAYSPAKPASNPPKLLLFDSHAPCPAQRAQRSRQAPLGCSSSLRQGGGTGDDLDKLGGDAGLAGPAEMQCSNIVREVPAQRC